MPDSAAPVVSRPGGALRLAAERGDGAALRYKDGDDWEDISYADLGTAVREVARGLIEAFHTIQPEVPFVVRLDGTNDEEGRRLLAEADLPNVHTEATMLGAAEKVVELSRA